MAMIIRKSKQQDIIITSTFHFSELSSSGGWFVGGSPEFSGVSWTLGLWRYDGGGDVCSFLIGTAGNDPLLLLVGRAMIFGGPIPSLGEGAAAKFGDSSASLRRTTFWTFSGSNSPTDDSDL